MTEKEVKTRPTKKLMLMYQWNDGTSRTNTPVTDSHQPAESILSQLKDVTNEKGVMSLLWLKGAWAEQISECVVLDTSGS